MSAPSQVNSHSDETQFQQLTHNNTKYLGPRAESSFMRNCQICINALKWAPVLFVTSVWQNDYKIDLSVTHHLIFSPFRSSAGVISPMWFNYVIVCCSWHLLMALYMKFNKYFLSSQYNFCDT